MRVGPRFRNLITKAGPRGGAAQELGSKRS